MDLYIFCVVLGAAGMAAMAFLGFAGSHGGGHHTHHTAGPNARHRRVAWARSGPHHALPHAPPSHASGNVGARSHSIAYAHGVPHSWASHVLSWLSPRVLFNFLVGFGATGLVLERLVGPMLALPIAVLGGVGFEALIRTTDIQFALSF